MIGAQSDEWKGNLLTPPPVDVKFDWDHFFVTNILTMWTAYRVKRDTFFHKMRRNYDATPVEPVKISNQMFVHHNVVE